MISRGFAAKATTNIVLKFGDSRPKGREVTGVRLKKLKKKFNYTKTGSFIKMIFRGFAAKAITHILLKFGDNRLKGRDKWALV